MGLDDLSCSFNRLTFHDSTTAGMPLAALMKAIAQFTVPLLQEKATVKDIGYCFPHQNSNSSIYKEYPEPEEII